MNSSKKIPLSKKVREWLDKQGYALEMSVAQSFDQVGFDVAISRYYLDLDSKELREIDVTASVNNQIEKTLISFDLYIECKYTKRPWVVFTSEKSVDRFGYFSRILRGNFELSNWKERPTLQARLVAKLLATFGRDKILKHQTFQLPNSVGYRITESLRDSNARDNAYNSLLQVTSSINAHDVRIEQILERQLDDFEEQFDRVAEPPEFTLYCGIGLPLVILRGKLFECYLDSAGEIAITEVKESIVMVSSKDIGEISPVDYVESPVRVITEDNIETFAKELFNSANKLMSQTEAINEVWQNERDKLPKKSPPDEIPF